MLKVSAVAESISAFSSRWPAELLPSMCSRGALFAAFVTVCVGTVPDYYRSLSFVISECTRRANISSHDLSMIMAIEGIQPRTFVASRPRLTRHGSLLQFATANAAYTSASGAHSPKSQQDVLLLLRSRCCSRVLTDIRSIQADSSLPVTPARSSPSFARSSPASRTPQPRASEPPGSRRVTRRASDSSTIKGNAEKLMDKGDKGSDSEGFSFGGIWNMAKKARKKMVRFFSALSRETLFILVDTGKIFWRIADK
jgi:hypothetical protein